MSDLPSYPIPESIPPHDNDHTTPQTSSDVGPRQVIAQDHPNPYVPREIPVRPSAAVPRATVSENIDVPRHLLATVSDRERWTPHEHSRRNSRNRSDSRNDFDIRHIAYEQKKRLQSRIDRSQSITIAQLARGRALRSTLAQEGQRDARRSPGNALAGDAPGQPLYRGDGGSHWRKTSLPTYSAPAKRTSLEPASTTTNDLASITAVPVGERHATQPGETILFTKLSSYNLASQGQAHVTFEDDVDPFSDGYDTNRTSFSETKDATADTNVGDHGRTSNMFRRDRGESIVQVAADTILHAVQTATAEVAKTIRRSSLADLYEKAKVRGHYLQRKKWVMVLFEWFVYVLLAAFVYLFLIGLPLWKGAVWWLFWVVSRKFTVAGTWAVTIGLAAIYAFAPLLVLFEKEPPMPPEDTILHANQTPGVHNVALLIPCYKSAKIVGPTLEAALKIFPAHHIYVIANGNSPTPLDNTEEVCARYGVNHIWSPVGSKIVAQFVGCYAVKRFENVLLIDDDCALPPNFPIVSDRLAGMVKCIGYTIKSVGPNSSKGTLCCQAQDIEYKLSGLQRQFAGAIGSATFPHGAISLWNTEFLISTFSAHPGFSVSEDWFFGHVARQLGCRILMCSAIFVETETPSAVFWSTGGSRGGFGEMTIFKQRFYRWNFFFVNGMYYNMAYILGSWKLGFWEFGAKVFVFQEVYETLLYLIAPFMLPISLAVRPAFCGYLTAATFVLYFVNVTIFNEVHLRLRNERVGFVALYLYYMPYKIALTGVNIASCYYSLYKYAKYFAKRHPKIIEDEKAVEVVLRLEETPASKRHEETQARQMAVTSVGVRLSHQSNRVSQTSHSLGPDTALARPSAAHLDLQSPIVEEHVMAHYSERGAAPKQRPLSTEAQELSDVIDFAFRRTSSSSGESELASEEVLSGTANRRLLRASVLSDQSESWQSDGAWTSDFFEHPRKTSAAQSLV